MEVLEGKKGLWSGHADAFPSLNYVPLTNAFSSQFFFLVS